MFKFYSQTVFKSIYYLAAISVESVCERDKVQGVRSTETGMYKEYMRISRTAQHRNLPAQLLS